MTDYLIVGNSAGGIGAIEAVREVDKDGTITVVGDEPFYAYSRPLISKYLACERSLDEMLFRDAYFYSQYNVRLITADKVVKIDADNHIAGLESGNNITWSNLLLATGGIPIVPDVKGADKEGVFSFIKLSDAQAIDGFIRQHDPIKAIVIGGGLIGISCTEALVKRVIEVTVVEMKDRLLNTILDERGSQIVEDTIIKKEVTLVLNNTVSEVLGEATVSGVVLSTGEQIPCDMVIMAIGVLPQTELAENAGITTNQGIIVDRTMSTNRPGVFACGDVSEAYDYIHDTNRLTPLWPNAYVGGRIAGFNMAGIRTEYKGGINMNSLSYFGFAIATAGIVDPSDQQPFEILGKQDDKTYQKIVLSENRIVGMIFMDDIDKSGVVFGLMRDGIDVSTFKESLLSDDFGLADFPVDLRKERLGTMQAV